MNYAVSACGLCCHAGGVMLMSSMCLRNIKHLQCLQDSEVSWHNDATWQTSHYHSSRQPLLWVTTGSTHFFIPVMQCMFITEVHRRLCRRRYAPRWVTGSNRVEKPPASSPSLLLSSTLGCSTTSRGEKTSFFTSDFCISWWILRTVNYFSSLQFVPLSTWWQMCSQI